MIQTIQPVRRQTIEKRQDVLFERFQAAPTKIALQKDGELTEISRVILAERYGLEVPPRNSRRLMSVSEDGRFGFVYARNKDICRLVSSGAVDVAIVGTDRLIEDGGEATLTVAASYENRYAWSVVLATRGDSTITNPEQIRRVATQYPEITKRYFAGLGLVVPEIIQTAGGTENKPA